MLHPAQSRCLSALGLLSATALALGPVAANAQQQPGYPQAGSYDPNQPPPPEYRGQPGYDDPPPANGQTAYGQPDAPPPPPPPPPPEPPAPQGYAAGQMPPPPPGYQPPPDYAAQAAADARYAADAQAWMRQWCVKSHGDVAAGAVIGGVLGAIIGGAAGGDRHGGEGAAFGALLGAGTGATVAAAQNNETSPGCPPGYKLRPGAPANPFVYSGYYYAAPGWYQPWVFTGGVWVYRPYPYHTWYWHTYRGPYWHGGYYRGGYRGGPGWHRP